MERDKNRGGICTLLIAASGWIIIGGAITYLELKRNAEINPLAERVNELMREVDALKAGMILMKNNTNYRFEALESSPRASAPAEPEYYDDTNFDDEYDDEIAEDDAADGDAKDAGTGGRGRRSSPIKRPKSVPRDRRSILGTSPLLAQSNALLRQKWATPGNHTRGVEAEIIVETPTNQEPQEGRPEEHIWHPSGACCQPIAAHFEGDVSNTRPAKSTHYQGNHRVFQQGVINEWEPASWMRELNLLSKFHLDASRSEISIKEESQGVYYVYAQVFYSDSHDTAGYGIFVNHENVFQCTVTSLHQADTHRHRTKSNSCFTGGLVRLNAGDKVTLREIEGTRSTVMHAPKSFIGMVRMYVA